MNTLTQLAPDLWLDLSQVVSVRTFTASHSYNRVVVLRTRCGAEHQIIAARTSGSAPASLGDRLLNEWLAEHLAPALFPDFKVRDHVADADALRKQVRG